MLRETVMPKCPYFARFCAFAAVNRKRSRNTASKVEKRRIGANPRVNHRGALLTNGARECGERESSAKAVPRTEWARPDAESLIDAKVPVFLRV
jgi:hypothetical protein